MHYFPHKLNVSKVNIHFSLEVNCLYLLGKLYCVEGVLYKKLSMQQYHKSQNTQQERTSIHPHLFFSFHINEVIPHLQAIIVLIHGRVDKIWMTL